MIILNLCGVMDTERSMLHHTLSREQSQSTRLVELKTIQHSIHLMLWCWQHFRRFWFNNDDEFPASQLNSIINFRVHNSFFLRFSFVIALVFYLFIYLFIFVWIFLAFLYLDYDVFFLIWNLVHITIIKGRWSQQPAIVDRPYIKSRNYYYSNRIV